MTIVTHAREADRIGNGETALERRPIDLTPVEGDWVSTTGLAGGVSRFRARGHNGSLLISASGYGATREGDWGEVPAQAFANTLRPGPGHAFTAFVATFDGAQVRTQLESYLALGLATGHAFHRFAEGSGRRDYFTREFYIPATGSRRPAEPGGADIHPLLRTGANEPGALLGTWDALAPTVTKGIYSLEVVPDGEDVLVQAYGVGADGPVDWGTTRAELYADAHYLDNAPAFLATFDHGYMQVHLQGRINRGSLVVCIFTTFTDDSGRSDYFVRECFGR
ncbi:hypothetical protein [Amycolatopsis taiwanensis]|uniref:hypothetical protein n=1 Tax=Amycolatopsis taiwanensis TaxID=342230 RepID=UPI0004862F75|nr:hypothetical protein [Amycolatopsis taiwanensis]